MNQFLLGFLKHISHYILLSGKWLNYIYKINILCHVLYTSQDEDGNRKLILITCLIKKNFYKISRFVWNHLLTLSYKINVIFLNYVKIVLISGKQKDISSKNKQNEFWIITSNLLHTLWELEQMQFVYFVLFWII